MPRVSLDGRRERTESKWTNVAMEWISIHRESNGAPQQ